MATKEITQTSMEEHRLLIEAATDFGNHSATDKTCPRCGGNIVLIETENSYTVKCSKVGCIEARFRGI